MFGRGPPLRLELERMRLLKCVVKRIRKLTFDKFCKMHYTGLCKFEAGNETIVLCKAFKCSSCEKQQK